MKQIVLGTAGHIDHGKTSLIKALSGIDTDRLKEEKERGITIELGFAYLKLPGGQLLGIVDVPGHEKFVKNMVAGATGIDLVALVIAADEGVMPQTKEHLEICELLKVKHGLVVLTKIDMVEPDWLELVKEDVKGYLSDTFLENAPMAEVSSTTGEGINELVQVINDVIQEIPERETGHIFRIPIDRVFTMKGFGTVITGTTVSGKIKTGDEITVYPQGIQSRIRGLQVHNREVNEIRAGLRTAINLQGIEKAMIHRGNVIAAKDSLRSTYMVDVSLTLLESAPRKLKNRAKVRFHTGTSEVIATVILMDRDILKPGENGYAQIRLDEPTAVVRKDRYVLRSYSPVRTIGGGEILNALPGKKRRFSDIHLSDFDVLNRGELNEIIEKFVSIGRFKGVKQKELSFLTNTGKKKLDDALKSLKAQKVLIRYDKEGEVLIHQTFFDRAQKEIVDTIAQYHKDFPLKVGLLKEELRSRTTGSTNPKLFSHLVNRLIQQNVIAQEKEIVRLKAHRVTLAQDQEKVRKKLEAIYFINGLQPPSLKDVKAKFEDSAAMDVLEVMVKEGAIVKVNEGLYFHGKSIDALKKKLLDFFKNNQQLSTPQFKEMTGVSRKFTIPLIEYFDRINVTVRIGDNRVLRKNPSR